MTKNYAIEILNESHIEEATTLIAKCFSGKGQWKKLIHPALMNSGNV